jgi:ribosomal protein S27E
MDGSEDLGTMDMGSEEDVQTLDMGEDTGDVELGSAITAVTSAPAARPRKPVRTVQCPGCRSAIPVYSETQTDIKCPNCGKAGRIKPMKKAPPPVEEAQDLSPLGSVLGTEPDLPLPPPPKAPSRPPKAAARPRPTSAPPKVPLKNMTCSGCRGKVPIYTDKRPIQITCPTCGKSGTLRN